jgi:hypothetical protein
MNSRGTNSWRPVARWRDLIAQKIAGQAVYVARLDDEIVGTITLEGFPIALYEKHISSTHNS